MQGPTALAVGADGGCLGIFSLVYYFSFFRLKYCLKGPLSLKQPMNQHVHWNFEQLHMQNMT